MREANRANSPGAGHASEIPYVFDSMWILAGGAPSKADQAMADLMHSCWVAFARIGRPACASGPAWPAYTDRSQQLMEFGAPSGVREHFRKSELDAMDAKYATGEASPF